MIDISAITQKLQLKAEYNILIINAPEEYLHYLGSLNLSSVDTEVAKGQAYQFVQVFAHNKAELKKLVPTAVKVLDKKGILWCSYPKKSSGIKTDITRDTGWNIMENLQYVPVSQVAIDEVWSALRFRPLNDVKLTRRTQGVRRPAIEVPEVFQNALNANPEAKEFFEKLAYTYRKEYAQWIGDAKKDETIQSRIKKAIELLKDERKLNA
ncbi:YdeI/OmpD-associated family protein [Limibacter armeniacum]|uniref:YdeI/OmpD-associated family protein n=1 Tax=Limibacter armeniacum TaxID=466084 RepID=UPI002FE6905C